jgi:uncharacterized protein (DUF169 family)/NAD-dependent dihydropyrimidine dehydrogenase PreA subunit
LYILHQIKDTIQEAQLTVKIEIDKERCRGCGICVDFCPTSVFELSDINGRKVSSAARRDDCCACNTCAGQCPEGAITLTDVIPERERLYSISAAAPAAPLDDEERQGYRKLSKSLVDILGLRWNPVAVTLISRDTALPDIPLPRSRLRYCQALMMARRGKTLLMPPQIHSCPDGMHILGLTTVPPKLATGEIYIKFGKLASIEAARRMIAERPHLPEKSVKATLVSPLDKAAMRPDVVVVVAAPESMMWLCMASSFYTGGRFQFKVSGYNSQCIEATLYPYTTGDINISLGCYGCRAASDIGDDMMFMGIPLVKLGSLVSGLERLAKKAIPDCRLKIYSPPLV